MHDMVHQNAETSLLREKQPKTTGASGQESREIRDVVQFRSNAPQLEDAISRVIDCCISNHVHNTSDLNKPTLKAYMFFDDWTYTMKVHAIRVVTGRFDSHWPLTRVESEASYAWSVLAQFRASCERDHPDVDVSTFNDLCRAFSGETKKMLRARAEKQKSYINSIIAGLKEKHKNKTSAIKLDRKRKIKDLKNNSFGELEDDLIPQALFEVGVDRDTNSNISKLVEVLENITLTGVNLNVQSPQLNSAFAVLDKMLDKIGWMTLFGALLLAWYYDLVSTTTVMIIGGFITLYKYDSVGVILSKCLSLDLSSLDDWLSSREDSRESSIFTEDDLDRFGPLVPQAGVDESLLITIISGVLAAISFTTFGDNFNTSIIKDFVSGWSTFKKKKTDLSALVTDFIGYISQFLQWLKEKFGWVPFELISCDREIQEWGENVSRAHEVLVTGKATDINAEYAEYVFSLFVVGNSLLRECPKDKPRQLESIKLWMSRLDTIIKHVKSCGWSNSYMRDVPLLVMVTGATGVGKTVAGTFFLQELLCRTLPQERRSNYKKNPMSELYARNIDTEFWDGYMYQWCVLYDEVGITKPELETKCNDITDLMKMVGTQEYILHMAHLANKGNTTFQSKIIYATTNMTGFDNRNEMPISYPEAFARRIAVPLFFTIKKEYALNPDAPLWERRPNKAHPIYANGFTTETYEIYLYKYWTENPSCVPAADRIDLSSKMTYNEALDLATSKFRESQRRGNLLRADLHRTVNSYDLTPQGLTDLPAMAIEALADNAKAWVNGVFTNLDRSPFDEYVHPEHVIGDEGIDWGHDGDFHTWRFQKFRAAMIYATHMNSMLGVRNLVPWRKEILKDGPVTPDRIAYALVRKYHYEDPVARAIVRVATRRCQDLVLILWQVLNDADKVSEWYFGTMIHIDDQQSESFARVFVDGWVEFFKSWSTSMFALPLIVFALRKLFGFGKRKKKNSRKKIKPQCIPNGDSSDSSEDEDVEPHSKGHHEPKVKDPKPSSKIWVKTTGKLGRAEPQANADPNTSEMQVMLMKRIMDANTYHIMDSRGSKMGYFSFIRGKCGVMPVHFKHLIEDARGKHPDIKYHLLSSDGKRIIDFDKASWTHYDRPDVPKFEDCLFVYVHDANMHTDVVKYMVYLDDKIYRDQISCVFAKPLQGSSFFVPVNCLYNKNRYYTQYIASDYLQYHLSAVKGDCGSLIWHNSSALPKLLAYHVAGNGSMNVGRVFDRKLCEEYLAEIEASLVPQADCPCGIQPNADGDYQQKVGTIDPKYASMGNPDSRLRKTRVFGLIEPNEVYPARLRPYKTEDGDLYDPTIECFKGYGPGPVDVNETLLSSIKEFVNDILWNRSDIGAQPWSPRLWNMQEACAGIDGVEFANSIPRSTSAGYKWSTYGSGKNAFFGKGQEFEFESNAYKELEQSVIAMRNKALNGERLGVIYQQFKKDETRPHPKNLRARMISASPLDYTILVRMYFGDAMRALMKNRILNHSAIGMNPYSIEWDLTAKRLSRFGNRVCDFDYRFYDQKAVRQFIEAACYYLKSYYADCPEEDNIVRDAIVNEIHHSVQAQGEILYMLCGGIPSGNPMTAPINTLANLTLVLYGIVVSMTRPDDLDHLKVDLKQSVNALRQLKGEFEMIALGDDNVWSVSENIPVIPGQVSEVLGKLGYTVTGADKQAVGGFKRLEDCTFLKRGFRFDDDLKVFVAPLALKTIKTFPYWTQISSTVQDEIDNMNLAIRELSLHSKEVYDELYPKYAKAMLKAYNCRPEWISQSTNKTVTLSMLSYYQSCRTPRVLFISSGEDLDEIWQWEMSLDSIISK